MQARRAGLERRQCPHSHRFSLPESCSVVLFCSESQNTGGRQYHHHSLLGSLRIRQPVLTPISGSDTYHSPIGLGYLQGYAAPP